MTEAPRVLITGAAGFVGIHTVRHFVERGWSVAGLDVTEPKEPVEGVTYVTGSILDPSLLEAVVAQHQVTGIVHLAALVREPICAADPVRAVEVNVLGTARVLELARAQNLRVTYLSTATLYGRDPSLRPLPEDSVPSPVALYDTTKYMAETLCMTYHSSFQLDVTIIRTGFVYGPGQWIDRYFVEHVAQGLAVEEPSGADHPCDYTYVKDLAQGLYLAHTVRPVTHRVFNITGGVLHRRRDLVAVVRAAFPEARIRLGEGINEKLNLRGACLIDRAREELGYQPHSLEAGVADWIADLPRAQPPVRRPDR